MPPKTAIAAAAGTSSTPGRPEPVTLDAIIDTLTSRDSAPASRAYHIVALCSVVHHPVVKQILANPQYQPALRVLVLSLMQRDAYSAESRWETLSVIGELCRVEQKEDVGGKAGGADALLEIAKTFFTYFSAQALLRDALATLVSEEGTIDTDCRIVAQDLHEALFGPLPEVPEKSRRPKPSSSTGATSTAAAAPTPAAATTATATTAPKGLQWGKPVREKLKDLMFLDASNKYALIPLVTRCSATLCSGCQKPLDTTKPLRCGQCKAAYYCSQPCQVAHWKAQHKGPCTAMKALMEGYLTATENGRRPAPANVAFPLEPSLFFETRTFLFQHRPETLRDITYEPYFMEYYTPTF